MPGVPRSRGCQTCKKRKLRCDETWPTCLRCAHINSVCPGPSSLVKFVVNGSHTSARKTGGQSATVPSRQSVKKTSIFPIQFHQVFRPGYEVLRPNPTPQSNRVVQRLINNLEQGPEGITTLRMSYLPDLPARLSESTCLRDSVDLFCSALIDFRSHRPQGEVMAMPQYGKALRSLRLALIGKQALKAETLAAIALIERMERLFKRGSASSVHGQGIIQVLKTKGPPNVKDHLDVAVANELHGLLLNDWALKESCGFFKESQWKEALDRGVEQYANTVDMGPFSKEDTAEFYTYTKQLQVLLFEFQQIYNQTYTQEIRPEIESLYQRVSQVEALVTKIAIASQEKALSQGAIVEAEDPKSIVGTRYAFRSAMIAVSYLGILAVQMILLRMIYELVTMIESPDAEWYGGRLKQVCRESWKAIPYLRSLESIVAENMMAPLYLSYEAADEREEEYLLDTVQYMDRYLERLPADRKLVQQVMIQTGRLMTGRTPPFNPS